MPTSQNLRKPPFVATQRVHRFAFTEAQRENAREYVTGDLLAHDGIAADGQTEGRHAKDRILQPVERHSFLLSLQGRGSRLCVTEDAGFGKSILLAQAEYLRQRHLPGHLVFRMELADLPIYGSHLLDERCQVTHHGGRTDWCDPTLVHSAATLLSDARNRTQVGRTFHDEAARRELQSWIKALIGRGCITLIVDGFDQVGTDEGERKTAALREFISMYPRVHMIVAGRPYAIKQYWKLFANRISSPNPQSEWEFCRVESFTLDEVRGYLGDACFNQVQQLEADALIVPRSVHAIWSMAGTEELATARTAADIYWHNVMDTLIQDVEHHRNRGRLTMGPPEIIDLLSLVAFGMLRWKGDGPILQIAEQEVVAFRRLLFHLGQHVFHWDEPTFDQKLSELMTINSSYVHGAFFGTMRDLRELRWRNATLRDFFAALWLVRSSTPDDRAWMGERRAIKHPSASNANLHAPYYESWRLTAGMRRQAFVLRYEVNVENTPIETRYVETVRSLFTRTKEPRPAELMHRSWPNLLRLANYLQQTEYDEDDILLATGAAQHEAWAASQSGQQTLTLDACKTTNPAKHLLMEWLLEYPNILNGREKNRARAIAEEFEESFREIPDGTQPLDFWYGQPDNKTRQLVGSRFRLARYQVTNQLVQLYDRNHGILRGNYKEYSPYDRAAAIYVSWYDAWCVATWLHGRLPTELEWEYACRARPGARPDVPHYLWHFGNDENLLGEYAWFRKNSAESESAESENGGRQQQVHAHTVGLKLPNSFDLCDMHGNVWEWCHDWAGADDTTSRVLRGGSFNDFANLARCSVRDGSVPAYSIISTGCRVARASSRKS